MLFSGFHLKRMIILFFNFVTIYIMLQYILYAKFYDDNFLHYWVISYFICQNSYSHVYGTFCTYFVNPSPAQPVTANPSKIFPISSLSLISIRIKYISLILIKVYPSHIFGKARNPKPAQRTASIPSKTLPPKSLRPAILLRALFLFSCPLCSFLSDTGRNNRPRFLKIFYRTEMYRPTMLNVQTEHNAEVKKMQHETSHSYLYNIALCSRS